MKHSKRRGSGKASSQASQDDDISVGNISYEPSDSEDEYTNQEKMLLEKARSSSSKKKPPKKLAVMDLPMYDDDEDEDDNGDDTNFQQDDDDDDDSDDVNMDSDIEGKEDDFNLPDQRAWGKTSKNYYNTDYVDQDYGGFDGEDADAAELEEQEAREIQKRLAAELDDNDFTLDVFTKSKEEDEVPSKISEEIIKTDLSQLSSRQKLALLQKEAPELIGIITEFRAAMEELQSRLQPAIALTQENYVLSPHLVHYIRTKYHLINNYVLNMGFYLLLRARRLPVAAHPVVKRLLQYRQLLQQLEPLETVASSQLDELLSAAKNGTLIPQRSTSEKTKKQGKNHLKLLSSIKSFETDEILNDVDVGKGKAASKGEGKLISKLKPEKSSGKIQINKSEMPWENSLEMDESKDMPWTNGAESESDDGSEDLDQSGAFDDSAEAEDGNSKRAITYQMAKNKGLTPHRKKENRNPRVKLRNKFRKAKIRRKGQVREPRTEVKRYGGEISGIKKTVTKSIKLK